MKDYEDDYNFRIFNEPVTIQLQPKYKADITPVINGPEEDLYSDEKPLVIGIYPSNSFGPIRQKALGLALDTHMVDTIFLNTLTIEELKKNQLYTYEIELKRLLKSRNVLAIVGPPCI